MTDDTTFDTTLRMSREWAMPRRDTFALPPVARLLARWLTGCRVVVDPFARNSTYGTLTNDLDPETSATSHLPAQEWLSGLGDGIADAGLCDPPYSPRQIAECYRHIGRDVSSSDTRNAALYAAVKDELARVVRLGGIVCCFGWNSSGCGASRGFTLLEVLLVPHGAAHNDTIVTVERKTSHQGQLWST